MAGRLTKALAKTSKDRLEVAKEDHEVRRLPSRMESAIGRYGPLLKVLGRDITEKLTPGMKEQRLQSEAMTDELAQKAGVQLRKDVATKPAPASGDDPKYVQRARDMTYGSNSEGYNKRRTNAMINKGYDSDLKRVGVTPTYDLSPSFKRALGMRRAGFEGEYVPDPAGGKITVDMYDRKDGKRPAGSEVLRHEEAHAFDLGGKRDIKDRPPESFVPPTITAEGSAEFMRRMRFYADGDSKFGAYLRDVFFPGMAVQRDDWGERPHEIYAEIMALVSPELLQSEAPLLYEMSPWK